MFTKTPDCLQIGNLRRHSKEYKTIPAVQFNCSNEDGEFMLNILALTFGSPVVRLTLEAMYLVAIGQMTEEEFVQTCNYDLILIRNNDESLKELLHKLRAKRVENYEGEIILKLSSKTLVATLSILEREGSLSFISIPDFPHSHYMYTLEDVTPKYLQVILGDNYEIVMSNISRNSEYVGRMGRYLYPEDCFINRGFMFLSYLNSVSGGEYSGYETLKHAYRVTPHFRDNPDFFDKTHCTCGGELVVRKKNGMYTLMSCINPYCSEKMAFALADFAKHMGILGLGAKTLSDMTQGLALKNLEENGDASVTYRMLLKLENSIYLGDANSLLWEDFLEAIENYTGTVKDLIIGMSLPYISSDASKILTVELLRNPTLTPDNLLAAANKSGKYDLKFVLNLWFNLADIKYVVLDLAKNLNLEVVTEYLIYITNGVKLELDNGNVIGYTKKQFENLVNKTLENAGIKKVRLKINGSLTHKCNVLIADQGQETSSCAKAESYGIPIMTSREFIQHLGGGNLE